MNDVRIFEVFEPPSLVRILSTDPFLISSNFLDPLPPKTENSLQFYTVRYHINLNNSQNANPSSNQVIFIIKKLLMPKLSNTLSGL